MTNDFGLEALDKLMGGFIDAVFAQTTEEYLNESLVDHLFNYLRGEGGDLQEENPEECGRRLQETTSGPLSEQDYELIKGLMVDMASIIGIQELPSLQAIETLLPVFEEAKSICESRNNPERCEENQLDLLVS